MCLSRFPPPQVFHIPEKDFQVIQIKTRKSSFISAFPLSIPNICQQDLKILSPAFTRYSYCPHLRSVWHHVLFILLESCLKKCHWNIVDLQCCASFRCTAKWIRCVCVFPAVQSPMDCSLADSSDHGIFQARILEWVAISYCWGPSWLRHQTHLSCVPCTGRQNQLYLYRHPLFLKSFSHIGHYRVLSIVPWALQ